MGACKQLIQGCEDKAQRVREAQFKRANEHRRTRWNDVFVGLGDS